MQGAYCDLQILLQAVFSLHERLSDFRNVKGQIRSAARYVQITHARADQCAGSACAIRRSFDTKIRLQRNVEPYVIVIKN